MGAVFSFPNVNEISTTLSLLLNKGVSVAEGAPVDTSQMIAGAYIDQQGQLGALGLVDLPLASYTGAALTMIPCDMATSHINAGKLSDEIRENLQEVFNVMVAFFNKGDVPHIRFSEMHITPPALPDDIATLLSGDLQRIDVDVDVSGYGAGKMSLYAL